MPKPSWARVVMGPPKTPPTPKKKQPPQRRRAASLSLRSTHRPRRPTRRLPWPRAYFSGPRAVVERQGLLLSLYIGLKDAPEAAVWRPSWHEYSFLHGATLEAAPWLREASFRAILAEATWLRRFFRMAPSDPWIGPPGTIRPTASMAGPSKARRRTGPCGLWPASCWRSARAS